jgi:hypothetical protein
MNRERWKILCHRNNYGRLATMSEISECAATLEQIDAERRLAEFKAKLNRTRYPNIWDFYHNQRGGSCNGY